MKINYLYIFIFSLPYSVSAGIETELARTISSNQCVIDIEHDATPDSETGTFVIRTYKKQNDIHEPCAAEQNEIANTLENAIQQYQLLELKPVASVFIGRLIHYQWVSDYLTEWSEVHDTLLGKVSRTEFHKDLMLSNVFSSFDSILSDNDFSLAGIECEKILYFETGVPQDAMCWLVIKENTLD